jgi:hypothetical protein
VRNRPGATSVAELVLVSWMFAIVLAGIARFAGDQNRLAALQRDRVRYQEAARTGLIVLGAELRFTSASDISATSDDSVRLRAFRGGGQVCGAQNGSVRVVYRGVRQPDPAKDSVLLLGPDGVETRRIESVRQSTDCGGSLELVMDEPARASAAYTLLFETGAYVLADGAVRYRRGAGGRQPLTEPVFRDMAFQGDAGALHLHLPPDPDSLPRLAGAPVRARIRSLNQGSLP